MTEDAKTLMDPLYGGGQATALQALGEPKRFRDCVAVILGKGGNNGYWMRLLGNENFPHRRVGSLVVTPEAVGYGELCARAPKPRSTAGMVMFMAKGKEGAFPGFTWTAKKDEIEELIIRPVNLSPHGAFASVEIQARGQRVHIGLGVGQPHIQDCVAALRHLAAIEHNVQADSASAPRTDGIYLFAANKRTSRFLAYYFNGAEAALIGLSDPAKNLRDLRSGEWEVALSPYQAEDGHFLVENEDHDLRRHVFIRADEQLIFQAEMHRAKADEYGEATSEFQFIPYSELTDGWGIPTIPGPLPGPDWPPVLTRSGDIEAAELGAPKARVKG